MKAGPDRKYTAAFRRSAVQQVEAGRTVAAAARSLEMSPKTLANWIYRARRGKKLVDREAAEATTDLQAEVSQLRAENARLKMEKEILKNRPRACTAPWIETGSAYILRGRMDGGRLLFGGIAPR